EHALLEKREALGRTHKWHRRAQGEQGIEVEPDEGQLHDPLPLGLEAAQVAIDVGRDLVGAERLLPSAPPARAPPPPGPERLPPRPTQTPPQPLEGAEMTRRRVLEPVAGPMTPPV